VSDNPKLGPTGDYPGGKLGPDDEGELTVAISVDDDRRIVRIDFGKPMEWLAFDPDGAIAFGSSIINAAMSVKFAGAIAMVEGADETKQ
jgi:hypothetical protein